MAVPRDGLIATDGPPTEVIEEEPRSEVYRQPVEVSRIRGPAMS